MYVTGLLIVDIQVASSFHHWNNTAVNIPVYLSLPIIFLTTYFKLSSFFLYAPSCMKKKKNLYPLAILHPQLLPYLLKGYQSGWIRGWKFNCPSQFPSQPDDARGQDAKRLCHHSEGWVVQPHLLSSRALPATSRGRNHPLPNSKCPQVSLPCRPQQSSKGPLLLSFVKSTLRVHGYWTSSVVSEL